MNAPMNFPAPSAPLYVLADNVDTLTLVDQLSARLAQLQALLAMTRGNAGDVFRRMDAENQEHYLWACGMIADEARELMGRIEGRRFAGQDDRGGRERV
ncbi:hypothetical protein [Zoogloea sp. LCSB751]|uniref:hypothetical protein n=1 Tax=Zoogloea sp. LCSB751 TaxID=1965277 RepID=UPI0011170976|nr:hypothetical protein [Zoogloea sp. LCSB751]